MLNEEQAKRVREIQLEIRAKFPLLDFPEPVLEPIYYGRFDKNSVTNRLLVMDRNTGSQYDIVSGRYDLIPHEVAVFNTLQAIPEEFGTPKLKFNFWQGGARFRMEATFPDVARLEVKPGDPVEPKIIQTNSLDRSTFYGMEFGAVELVCTNGLVSYRKKGGSSRRHIYGAEDTIDIANGMKKEMENFADQVGIWSRWNEIQIGTIEEAELVISDIPFSEKEQESVLLLPLMNNDNQTVRGLIEQGKATLWDVHSAATQFTTWDIHTDHRKFDIESKIGKTFHLFNEKKEAA